MTSTKYSIDSSALMDGWIRHYPPDHFPRFWERIDALADERRFLVSEEVFEEIDEHDDSLKEWLNDRRDGIIVHTVVRASGDNFVAQDVRQILASHERLVMSGTRRNRADPLLSGIAVARLRGATVVTRREGWDCKEGPRSVSMPITTSPGPAACCATSSCSPKIPSV